MELEELRTKFEQAKRAGNQAMILETVQTELLFYIAERLKEINHE